MEEQQLERVPPRAPAGVELTRVWKGCKRTREEKKQQNPSTPNSPACQDLWLSLHCLPVHTPRELVCPKGTKQRGHVSRTRDGQPEAPERCRGCGVR